MNRKTQLILFSSLAFLYLVIAPILIFYSLGYRVDFEKKKLASTGGLYLKIWPKDVEVSIDNKIKKNTGLFSNEILIQGLFPKKHAILVRKEGYSSWQKSLETQEKQVIKVDNVTLIKEKILFKKLKDNIRNLYISPSGNLLLLLNSLEYSFSIIDSETMAEKNSFSLPENTEDDVGVVFWNENQKIITLKTKDNYFSVDYNKPGVIKSKTTLFKDDEKIVTDGKLTFEKKDGYIYLLNEQTNKFDNFYQANNIIFSPDKSRFLFFNDHEILFSNTAKPEEKIFLMRFSEKINDCFWLNNNYIIFDVAGSVKISEIDTRDKINMVDLGTKINLPANGSIDQSVELKNPKILFDEINKKLYILNENALFVSEPLTDRNNR